MLRLRSVEVCHRRGSQANGPRGGSDGVRSRLLVDMSDGACQAGDQAEVEENSGRDDDAAAVRCSRIEAAVRR
jgi:hypothetical protein